MKMFSLLLAGILSATVLVSDVQAATERWSVEKAREWYAGQPWLVGANFSPASAVNQLEMWQADTFDPKEIDRELGWAHGLGFNTMRVFLHNLLWEQDAKGLLERVDQFLALCEKHRIRPMLVLLDDVWNPDPKLGRQPAPRRGVHNSGWVQAPGRAVLADESRWSAIRDYVAGVIGHFKDDARILAWDLYNEPGNLNGPPYRELEPKNKEELSLKLLGKVFEWAREVDPSQPLTAGVWAGEWTDPAKLGPFNRLQIESSDVLSFHQYEPLDRTREVALALLKYDRPVLCTEYMARPRGSTFEAILPFFKEHKIAAYCWGFVAGKTNTLHAWDTWKKADVGEPKVWFHDVLRADGSAYSQDEINFLKKILGAP